MEQRIATIVADSARDEGHCFVLHRTLIQRQWTSC